MSAIRASIVCTRLDQLKRPGAGNHPWAVEPRGDLEGEQFSKRGR